MISRKTLGVGNNRRLYCAIGVFLLAIGLPSPANSAEKGPSAWWPDPATGLMWANQAESGWLNWSEASDRCDHLTLGGFGGWRLPTLDEAKLSITYRTDYPVQGMTAKRPKGSAIPHNPADNFPPDPETFPVLKGAVSLPSFALWSSTKQGGQEAWTIGQGDFATANVSSGYRHMAICVRTMEPDLLQLAKAAQVPSPVPDVETLRAYVPLNQARASFAAGQYQAAIAQADSALTLNPKSAPAFWAIGVSYSMLGQWDQAVTNLQSAVKIDKNYNHGKTALKWAQKGQQAAQHGKGPTGNAPVWE